MKYGLFIGDHYYPWGGLQDFYGFAETAEEARSIVDRYREVAVQINISTSDLWAEVIEIDGDTIHLLWKFDHGQWSGATILPSDFVIEVQQVLAPGFVETRLKELAEVKAYHEKKKAIEAAYKNLFDAIGADDKEAVQKYHDELKDLEES